jgi:hypothetical protein
VLQKLTIVRQPGGITNAAPNKANFIQLAVRSADNF